MGLCVAGLGLLLLAALLVAYAGDDSGALDTMLHSLAAGVSSIAVFSRIAGGIYTKAADVGADIVGKVEADLPEDDPRSPAVIADNVGDTAGDVADTAVTHEGANILVSVRANGEV
jgi:K(+)-stimulated pyrophosphate-energized sodium pump